LYNFIPSDGLVFIFQFPASSGRFIQQQIGCSKV